MKNYYDNRKEYELKDEINQYFQAAFSILKELGVYVPKYESYSDLYRLKED